MSAKNALIIQGSFLLQLSVKQSETNHREQLAKRLRPKIYKKSLYIGNKMIFRFTKEYTKKFFFKAIWVFMLFVMLLTIIFGGLAILIGNSVPQQ